MNHGEIVSFIWGVADLIRDSFKRGKYQDVILPLTVLRRLDCVLAPTKDAVLRRQGALRARGLEDLYAQLCKASGFGPNGSGKSNFLDAMALLQAAPRGIAEPITRMGGVDNWLWKGSETLQTIGIEAELDYPYAGVLRHSIVLSDRIGPQFVESALRRWPDLEAVPQATVLDALKRATAGCPKPYSKGKVSFELLAHVEPVRVESACLHAMMLLNRLRTR